MVQRTAIVNSNESIYAIKVINGIAKKENVKRGREEDDKIEIYGNLTPGDNLVKMLQRKLKKAPNRTLQILYKEKIIDFL